MKCIFWGRNFKEHLCFEMHFLRERFWCAAMFWKCICLGSNFEKHLCSEMHFLREQLSIFTAKLYSLINILFYNWQYGSVAKWIENVALNRLSLWWRELNLLRSRFSVTITVGWRPIRCKNISSLIYHWS